MSIKFRVVTRPVPAGKNKGQTMQFAQALTSKRITFKRLCEEIADGSTVDTADVKAVLDRLVRVMRRHLEDGESVECGDLGTFSTTFGSEGIPLEEEFRSSIHIRKPRIAFRSKPEFKELTNVRFERISAEEEELRNAITAKKKGLKPNVSPEDNQLETDQPRTGI